MNISNLTVLTSQDKGDDLIFLPKKGGGLSIVSPTAKKISPSNLPKSSRSPKYATKASALTKDLNRERRRERGISCVSDRTVKSAYAAANVFSAHTQILHSDSQGTSSVESSVDTTTCDFRPSSRARSWSMASDSSSISPLGHDLQKMGLQPTPSRHLQLGQPQDALSSTYHSSWDADDEFCETPRKLARSSSKTSVHSDGSFQGLRSLTASRFDESQHHLASKTRDLYPSVRIEGVGAPSRYAASCDHIDGTLLPETHLEDPFMDVHDEDMLDIEIWGDVLDESHHKGFAVMYIPLTFHALQKVNSETLSMRNNTSSTSEDSVLEITHSCNQFTSANPITRANSTTFMQQDGPLDSDFLACWSPITVLETSQQSADSPTLHQIAEHESEENKAVVQDCGYNSMRTSQETRFSEEILYPIDCVDDQGDEQGLCTNDLSEDECNKMSCSPLLFRLHEEDTAAERTALGLDDELANAYGADMSSQQPCSTFCRNLKPVQVAALARAALLGEDSYDSSQKNFHGDEPPLRTLNDFKKRKHITSQSSQDSSKVPCSIDTRYLDKRNHSARRAEMLLRMQAQQNPEPLAPFDSSPYFKLYANNQERATAIPPQPYPVPMLRDESDGNTNHRSVRGAAFSHGRHQRALRYTPTVFDPSFDREHYTPPSAYGRQQYDLAQSSSQLQPAVVRGIALSTETMFPGVEEVFGPWH